MAGLGANIFQLIYGTHIFSGSNPDLHNMELHATYKDVNPVFSGSNPDLHNMGGLATYKDVDPDSIIKTEKWGYVPANQVIIVFDNDVGKSEAK